ncbi:Hpt domain-containing protein [Sphingobacterium zeae]|uniref:HPt (Histidine-containing phosphotransfer) domain-containing protein n=1 Tax=Sphingobacterium zeae TaxID=1776859 RepID=A0ABU0U9R8_9SPHI|nr:Hpt domain-containing protein [Sphingobacterium zeae]MDQ1151610.1 HPt (histidine-containing phosphotransfer) domain-containing protein [Sphingobacterium zeae]
MNHLDIELISLNMFDNQELIKQFVSMYLIQTPVDLDKLRQALAEGNLQKIGDAAHHIKPTMDYIGAFHLKEKFEELENHAKNKESLEILRATFGIIDIEMKELLFELEQYEKTI